MKKKITIDLCLLCSWFIVHGSLKNREQAAGSRRQNVLLRRQKRNGRSNDGEVSSPSATSTRQKRGGRSGI
jgi:hypothetical protein